MSEDVNTKLIEGHIFKLTRLKYKFSLAEEIKKYVPSILKRNFASNKVIFNGKLVRMVSDLYLSTESISIQSVRYFEGQCTNELVYKKIKSNFSLESFFIGKALLTSDDNTLHDLELSSCANYIGASTLVITKDNYIILGKQGDFSRANAGRYAPSGSGSVNFRDLKDKIDFNSLVINAMEREFCEENNYSYDNKDRIHTILIGYVRLLERGGKPDFFGLSFIDEYSYNLKNRIKATELGIEQESLFIEINKSNSIGETLLNFCNNNISEKNLSIQLMILAKLIHKYEK